MARNLIIGDKVAYTRTFLESGAIERRDRYAMSTRRGTITAIEAECLATVAWDDGLSHRTTVHVANICRPRSVAFVESVR